MKVREKLQVDELDAGTRNMIWNEILMYFKAISDYPIVIRRMRADLFELPIDSKPFIIKTTSYGKEKFFVGYDAWLKNKISNGSIAEVLDVVEYLTDQERSDEWVAQYAMAFHSEVGGQMLALSQETVDDLFAGMCVGYRFVNGVLCRIVNEEEIKSIESAIAESPDAVAEQLNNALLAFADRERPNYANVVKESISGVESQCCILTGDSKASLGAALKKLEDSGVRIHPALNKALHQLYGYTSDDPGIRHGGAAMANVDVALAQFMLVTCSAFVNYLRTVKVTIGG